MPSLKTGLVTAGILIVALFIIARFAPSTFKTSIGLPSSAA